MGVQQPVQLPDTRRGNGHSCTAECMRVSPAISDLPAVRLLDKKTDALRYCHGSAVGALDLGRCEARTSQRLIAKCCA